MQEIESSNVFLERATSNLGLPNQFLKFTYQVNMKTVFKYLQYFLVYSLALCASEICDSRDLTRGDTVGIPI